MILELFPIANRGAYSKVQYYIGLMKALGQVQTFAEATYLSEEDIDELEERIQHFKKLLFSVSFLIKIILFESTFSIRPQD